jgi:hypothetical protein
MGKTGEDITGDEGTNAIDYRMPSGDSGYLNLGLEGVLVMTALLNRAAVECRPTADDLKPPAEYYRAIHVANPFRFGVRQIQTTAPHSAAARQNSLERRRRRKVSAVAHI